MREIYGYQQSLISAMLDELARERRMFIKPPPSNIMPPRVMNATAKPTRHDPQPNKAPMGKRKRQWK